MKSLAAFRKLDRDVQRALVCRVIIRKEKFLELTREMKAREPNILIVGAQPATDGEYDPKAHYTPFGVRWNSSLWVNHQLHLGGVDEKKLTWVNALDYHGNPITYDILDFPWTRIVGLGGVASNWIAKSPQNPSRIVVPHPSYWKRFRSKEPYSLINVLK